MSDRERWIIYPLLFLALGAALRDKLTRSIENVDVVKARAAQFEVLEGKAASFGAVQGQGATVDFETGDIRCRRLVVNELLVVDPHDSANRPLVALGVLSPTKTGAVSGAINIMNASGNVIASLGQSPDGKAGQFVAFDAASGKARAVLTHAAGGARMSLTDSTNTFELMLGEIGHEMGLFVLSADGKIGKLSNTFIRPALAPEPTSDEPHKGS